MNPKIRLLVLKVRSELLEKTLEFYSTLGFSFKKEMHDRGPVHYSCDTGDYVFELYPLSPGEGYPMPQARLGFSLPASVIRELEIKGFECFEKSYGSLTRDPMGRFIELYLHYS